MKTFEERYTAWIDGELEGNALTAFEQELTRRAAAGEAAEDKSDATRLRALLQDHLQAPALTNPDFFSHQLRERIDAEAAAVSRGREPNRRAEPSILCLGSGPADRPGSGEFVRGGGVVLWDDAAAHRLVAGSCRCRQP